MCIRDRPNNYSVVLENWNEEKALYLARLEELVEDVYKRQGLAYKAPLYGRRTAQMKILPFDFEETCQYFKNFTDEEKAYVYGIVGGTPQYLLQMSDKLSICLLYTSRCV